MEEFGVKNVIFILVLIAAMAMLFKNLSKLFSYMKLAQPESRTDNPGKRIVYMFKVALAQSKIMREQPAGVIHVGIFWGFLVFLFSASEAVFQGFYPGFSWSFLGPVFSAITLLTDIFCGLIILAVLGALYRRFVLKVKRLQGDSSEKRDAVVVLLSIFIITSGLLLQNSALSALHPNEAWALRPLSSALGAGFSVDAARVAFEIGWWLHIVVILAFANYLPFSKHFHVYTSVPNVYLSNLGPVNKLPRIDFEQEGLEKFGVVDFEDLTWKNVLDSYTCTHCGRCTAACPANITGKVLSPREVIVEVRERTQDRAPLLQKVSAGAELGEAEQAIMDKKFVGEYENITALWQCTTCGACMQECPVTIEHVPQIVGMRRNLVMMESNFPAELASTFANLENNGAPWAFSQAERADWAEGTGVRTAAEHPDFDVLFWVGCSGSFDDRAKKISRAFAKLMQEAGVNFAILGTEERCNGDIARRTGNEYLADMLVKQNIETMERYGVKKIVTICPHCFNTMKNEYPDFGGKYEVVHHAEYLEQLIAEGKLKLKKDGKAGEKVAYHDSCYLGRYNGIYEAPRKTLMAAGFEIIDPERSGDRGLCCGAGGGQMFMEETEGKRVNIERSEELVAQGASTIASNCPFCMTMITDGVKAMDKIDDIAVKDIAEILLERLA